VQAVLVVDDGSGPEYQDIFREVSQIAGVSLLKHIVNLGKGAALKTGLNYAAFELEVLLACKRTKRTVSELAIETVYLDGNRSSHFNPLLDSMRIYFLLLRFGAVSLSTAVLDNSVFHAEVRSRRALPRYWLCAGTFGLLSLIQFLMSLGFAVPSAKLCAEKSERLCIRRRRSGRGREVLRGGASSRRCSAFRNPIRSWWNSGAQIAVCSTQ
jgi:glycosyltransferase involved in cell wall biosynthesis